MRGNGDTDGLMEDEYTKQELDDALEVIAWLARQNWCSGKVGMFGISWGGFNALQVAARKPPALKAIVTMCSTDDRYEDDVHYKGGRCSTRSWAGPRPCWPIPRGRPTPRSSATVAQDVDGAAGERALPRVPWLGHPHRDAYWKHGSVCEDFAAIEAPMLAVGGWGDAYKNAVPRLVKGLRAEEGHHRALDPQISAFRRSRSRHRIPAGGAALVGPLAEGRNHRGLPRSGLPATS